MTHDDMTMVPYEARNPGLVLPLVDSSTAKAAIAQYEALKAAIVQPSDVQNISGRTFLKKSFWRRVATCFGLSLELVREERSFDEAGNLSYSVLYRAIAPNGRAMTGDGMYVNGEKVDRNGKPVYVSEHFIRATAHTRAKNRAISDLVGGGEVSAEEMPDDEPRQQPVQRPTPIKRQAPAVSAQVYAVPSEPEPMEDVDDAGQPWAFIRDVDFRQALNKMGIRSVGAVQDFVENVTHKPHAEVRRADRTVCMEQAIELAKTAVPASLEGLPVGKRGQ